MLRFAAKAESPSSSSMSALFCCATELDLRWWVPSLGEIGMSIAVVPS
jgi:hypothetical protein